MTRRTWVAGSLLAAPAVSEPLRLPHKVRLALIGMQGHVGEILTPLKDLPDVELVAISDPDPKATAALARRQNMPSLRQYTDYRRLLDQEKLEMVGICGTNSVRTPAILAAAQRKLHIVAEKPLAIEKADLERIKKAVDHNGVRLTMLLPMRFSRIYRGMKQIVDSGQIGQVAQMGAQKSYKLGDRPEWMRKRSSFGGTIPYIGVHMVDLMRFTSGREIVETIAFQSRVGYPELGDMENTTATLFRLDNGGTAALRMDYLRPETAPTHGDDRPRLAGTEGVLEYQAATGLTLVTRKEKPRVVSDLPPGQPAVCRFSERCISFRAVGTRTQRYLQGERNRASGSRGCGARTDREGLKFARWDCASRKRPAAVFRR